MLIDLTPKDLDLFLVKTASNQPQFINKKISTRGYAEIHTQRPFFDNKNSI
jgi:hypothetical protein